MSGDAAEHASAALRTRAPAPPRVSSFGTTEDWVAIWVWLATGRAYQQVFAKAVPSPNVAETRHESGNTSSESFGGPPAFFAHVRLMRR
jgi:hypothetical protein